VEKLPFIPYQAIRRSSIHDRFGGNRQSGISPSANYPYIFIFSGKQGKEHGYNDGWDNANVYFYSGEGQDGNMEFIRGNLALRDHKRNGKRIFFFEYVQKGFVQFISELEVFDVDFIDTIDSSGNLRKGIKFFLNRIGISIPKNFELFNQTYQLAEPDILPNYVMPNSTERSGLVTSRVGQGAYRKRIIHRWEYKCAVTGFDKPEILIASHIIPWKHANEHERLDVNNGILLSPVYDALFDKHLISFEDNGKILLSDRIESSAYKQIGVNGVERINNFNSDNGIYLEKHREQFIKINL
jgi:5-methylcytosine-specific restriction protein A